MLEQIKDAIQVIFWIYLGFVLSIAALGYLIGWYHKLTETEEDDRNEATRRE